MVTRTYGQYCGFSRALELVGERWALLIIRDLLIGPKRFSDLQRGLPGIPTNILTARLKELEETGLVRRVVLPRPRGGVGYELTADGKELEDAVITIGRWGAKRLGEPRAGEVVTEDSMAAALRTTFRPEAAGKENANYEVRLGDIIVHARVRGGKIVVGRGSLPDADLIIASGPALRQLLARELTPEEAIRKKAVRIIKGDLRLLNRFAKQFQI